MKKTLLFLFLIFAVINGQNAKFAYPIIFLHGLVSSNDTWDEAVSALGGSEKIFDVCLNHDGNNFTASLTSDISVIGWRDGNSTPSLNRLYVMNFDHTKFQATGHTSHVFSNQAAIFKQGVALKAMIQAVLSIENSDKVILIGHSMGGLETREYLQRGYNGTSTGRGINWVDQTSEFGHRIAKAVSLGTPHLGSNHTGGVISILLNGVDEKSEACRDLRYSQTPSTTPYLFGGNESSYMWNTAPFNKDVNCNGTSMDNITSLSTGTSFNASMPLPENIPYRWITSNYNGSNQDGLVEISRQWLHNSSTIAPSTADTLLININHISEPNSILTIIRGLDEPSEPNFAFELKTGILTKGYISHGMNWNSRDVDAFSFKSTENRGLEITLDNVNSGTDSLIFYDGSNIITGKVINNGIQTFIVENLIQNKTYHIIIKGTATSSNWQNPYSILCRYVTTSNIEGNEIPLSFQLNQNFPNPFNPETVIRYCIPKNAHVKLFVYNALGEETAKLVDAFQVQNFYEIKFNPKGLASGVYFYRIEANYLDDNPSFSSIKKMVLLK